MKIVALEIKHSFGERENLIYPAAAMDENELVLIDCGYPGDLSYIENAAGEHDIDINRLTKIIITHHDYDHMGALGAFKRKYPKVQVISSVIEADYISGKKKSLRLQQAEKLQELLPEAEQEQGRRFMAQLEAIENVPVDLWVEDKAVLPCCGGMEIIATPGHMPGHICVYLKESKTLIAGDAMVVNGGELLMANPQYTLDMEGAKASVEKLLDYEIDTILCYHGGICSGNIKEKLQKILK